jgi:hypothetical protein
MKNISDSLDEVMDLIRVLDKKVEEVIVRLKKLEDR